MKTFKLPKKKKEGIENKSQIEQIKKNHFLDTTILLAVRFQKSITNLLSSIYLKRCKVSYPFLPPLLHLVKRNKALESKL